MRFIKAFLILLALVQCSEDEISPEWKNKIKKETHYHSTDLTTPHTYVLHQYNDDGLLIQSQEFDSDSELIKDSYYFYNDRSNLNRFLQNEFFIDGAERNSEQINFYNDNDQIYRREEYENGSLVSVQTNTYTPFGKHERVQITSYNPAFSGDSFMRYDSSERLTASINYVDGVHSSSTNFEYPAEGMDRNFWTYEGKDSILWMHGEERYTNNRIALRKSISHPDRDTYTSKYYYNENSDLWKETYEKNGDERIRIENTFQGPLLMENRHYFIDFDSAKDDYYLTIYEYY